MTGGYVASLPTQAAPGSAGRTRLIMVPDRAGAAQCPTTVPDRAGAAQCPTASTAHRDEPAPLAVAVTAGDTITAEGTEAYLRAAEGVRVVDWGAWDSADIALVLEHQVSDRTIAWMERVNRETEARGGLPILLVADEISERDFVRAVRHGLVGVLFRREVGYARVLEAARDAFRGGAPMSAPLVRSLVDNVRSLASALHTYETDLSAREVDVLRLIAEGHSTADVAARLNYSERTIKKVLQEMMGRLGLRNRTHAVAYAIRKGVV